MSDAAVGVAFVELTPESFPLTVEFVDADTNEVLHTSVVEGPGAMEVPSRGALGARELKVITYWPDGSVITS